MFTIFGVEMPGISMPGGTTLFFVPFSSHYAHSDIIVIMSQKVVIERVVIRGATPYLGMCATEGEQQVPLYSTNPDIVMRWLCDGWRCRYN